MTDRMATVQAAFTSAPLTLAAGELGEVVKWVRVAPAQEIEWRIRVPGRRITIPVAGSYLIEVNYNGAGELIGQRVTLLDDDRRN